ncbi:MAG: YebC/PmpR family DNA-binding transcriptional regulator [Alphaproteobacteria bacterium]|nr:MAG: YebC/PmpR family DNA-binding transcriptional regulator [Alphaproteobacteria bacterium]
MAGHSQFKNIMYRKGAQDAKRARLFAKIIREITVSGKESPDPDSNPRLRSAIADARTNNMPKDTIERALKKATGSANDTHYEDVRYEGYGPSGVAIIVDALTDNRNRTASDVRSAFSKYGGNLGESNSVAFMFDRMGCFTYPLSLGNEEHVFETALTVGAEDVKVHAENYAIFCTADTFHQVRDDLEKKVGSPESSGLQWIAKSPAEITDADIARKVLRLIDALEESDDVQSVSTNMHLSDAVVAVLNEAH